MKKTLIVAALAVALVLMFSASALAVGPFFLSGTAGSNTNNSPAFLGYLSWGYVTFGTGNVGLTPHGNYSTTTNKCQVCHAVHRAVKGGSVLTAIPSATTSATNMNTTLQTAPPAYAAGAASGSSGYTKGCAWCHNIGGFATSIAMSPGGTISPHSNCNRCHTASPHGVGGSEYTVLAARMLNEEADFAIEADLASGNNGMSDTWFGKTDGSVVLDPAKAQLGVTLGTGYLCNCCHSGGSGGAPNNAQGLAFAVNVAGASPTVGGEGTTTVTLGKKTGHRVTAVVTDWNGQTATTYTAGVWDPSVARRYNAFYTGGSFWGTEEVSYPAGSSTVAWAPSNTCQSCHDQKLANGDNAFPHGYVNASGAYVGNVTGAGYIWMTYAADAAASKTVLAKTGAANQANALLSQDGLCLKCHVKDAVSGEGVGENF